VPTLRHCRTAASLTLDPLWAALIGLVVGLSLGGHLASVPSLLALIAGSWAS
jgi:hypothetical protein